MKKYFTNLIIRDHIFTLTCCIFTIASVLLFLPDNALSDIIQFLCSIIFIFSLCYCIHKLRQADRIVRNSFLYDHSFRYIENAVFTEENVFGYSFQKMCAINYHDINLVRHTDNIYEKTRPGYKGNHKVLIQSENHQILIPVENAEIAERILNFIQTKNPAAAFQHKSSPFIKTELSDLENWTVKGRF